MKTSLRDLVDADLPLTEKQLEEIFQEVQRWNPPKAKETVIMCVVCLAPLIALVVLGSLLEDYVGPKLASVIGAVLALAWLYIAFMWWMSRRANVSLFRRALNCKGYPICVSCGYWLRGLGDDMEKCPECGGGVKPGDRILEYPKRF